MKISYYNIGCKVNFADVSQIIEEFKDEGAELVDFGVNSDVVLINTCTVTNQADADCRKVIRKAVKSSPNAFIGVIGCYAQIKSDDISKIEGVSGIFGNHDKFRIKELVKDFRKNQSPSIFITNDEDIPFHTSTSYDNDSHTRIVFKIQDGCDYVCTYCTIPFARGKSRSMDFSELKNKLIEFNNSRFSEIIFSGINLGEYLAPTGEKFIDVLKFVDELKPRYRVRISSIEPNLITDEIIDLVSKSDYICKHFHIPLQSGSPEVLKLMKRRYKLERFLDRIEKIKDKIPNCCIGIDVITGFPGETDQYFEDTFMLLESLPVSYLHVFTYSNRELAPASKYDNQIDGQIKKGRTARLKHLSERKKIDFYKTQIGLDQIVIPETFSEEKGIWKGWTDNYVATEFTGQNDIYNKLIRIKLNSIKNDKVLAELVG
jgi:threonylcarbamoyladenosine tRNA methylthiotransferase MtaB